MDTFDIKSISPLYEFWESQQSDADELKRLELSNQKSEAVVLFVKEPYKWEILYQCTMFDILKGDSDATSALIILLGTIKESARSEFINKARASKLLDEEVIYCLDKPPVRKQSKVHKFYKKIGILASIFFNPYGVNLKGKKQHVYEVTGYLCYLLKEFFGNS
tara:strand:+ start:1246 stop:1734 length:489 start_codon:yes stop_codon:yes gene_type:complete